MTVPDELVQAVYFDANADPQYFGLPDGVVARVLAAVPDGWAKIDGEWTQLQQMVVRDLDSATPVVVKGVRRD